MFFLRSWLSHEVPFVRTLTAEPEKGEAVAAGQRAQKRESATGNVGSFVSPDSLATFGGATFGITVIWGGIERLFGLGHFLWIGAVISAIAGLYLFFSDATDPRKSPKPSRNGRIAAAVVNTFVLFNAASGATALTGVAGADTSPTRPKTAATSSNIR